MNPLMLNRVREDTPPLNPDIANGLAMKYLPYAEEYIDSVWKVICNDFPTGLKYMGMVRCTPEEEFYSDNRQRNSRRVVDIARSDIYLAKANFTFNDEPLPPRYFYLPFVGEAGSIALGGPIYFISPILSDIVLSYEPDNVFVKLLRDKFTMRRITHNIVIEGKIETMSVVWSMIHHISVTQRGSLTGRAQCTLFHYLLCRYGFSQIFEQYYGFKPMVFSQAIDPAQYPPTKWVYVMSTQFRPKGLSEKFSYMPTSIRVAVPRDKFTPEVKNMLAAFFYIVDFFPSRVQPEYVDNTSLWKTLMGHIIFGSDMSEGKLHDDTDRHIQSLDEYVDVITQARFREIDIHIKDIYQFFVIAIERFNEWLRVGMEESNSLYNKELTVLQEVLSPITNSMFNMLFKLKTAAKKSLSKNEVIQTMNKCFKPRVIFRLTDQTSGVSNMSYSGDNKCMKITATVVPQKRSGGKGGSSNVNLEDPSKRLHVSFAEVGSYINLSDSNLTGGNKINPHLKLTDSGKIIRDPELKPMLDAVQEMIYRRS